MTAGDLGLTLFVRLYNLAPTLLLISAALALVVWARRRVRSALAEAEPQASPGPTGAVAVARILGAGGLAPAVPVVEARGPLATYYDPIRRELRLDERLARGTTPGQLGRAALEAGHALLEAQRGRAPGLARRLLVFAAGLGAAGSWIVLLAGILLDIPDLAFRGAVLYAVAVAAGLALGPIERAAAARVRHALEQVDLGTAPADPAFEAGLRAGGLDVLAALLPFRTMPASAERTRPRRGSSPP